ncbi:MAG: hypothetical protein ACI9XJ_002605 [Marivirga sp.]|jgi:hypothetical protein
MKLFFKSGFLLLFAVTTLLGCNRKVANSISEDGLWTLESMILSNGQSIDRKPYNQGIENAMAARLPWVYSPLTIALKVAGQQMISPQVNMVSKSLSGNELVTEVAVIIEKKNLPDDSLADEYFWMRLKLGGTIWQVAEIKHAWRCREGRGHQELSAEKCL